MLAVCRSTFAHSLKNSVGRLSDTRFRGKRDALGYGISSICPLVSMHDDDKLFMSIITSTEALKAVAIDVQVSSGVTLYSNGGVDDFVMVGVEVEKSVCINVAGIGV